MKQRDRMAQQVAQSRLSRRSFLCAGPVIATAAFAAGLSAGRASAEAKLPQNQVSYQSSPKNDKRCKACVNYEGNNTCRVVAGEISPEGWCRLWNAR